MTPAAEARRIYAESFDDFRDRQRGYAPLLPELANEVGHVAFLFLRAFKAELTNPEPARAPNCGCADCRLYRLVGDKSEPAMERVS